MSRISEDSCKDYPRNYFKLPGKPFFRTHMVDSFWNWVLYQVLLFSDTSQWKFIFQILTKSFTTFLLIKKDFKRVCCFHILLQKEAQKKLCKIPFYFAEIFLLFLFSFFFSRYSNFGTFLFPIFSPVSHC